MHQLPMTNLLGADYAAAIATIRRLNVTPDIARMHLAHGIRTDQTCQECRHFAYLAVHGGYHVCQLARTWKAWDGNTAACGKFEERKERG